MVVDFVTTIPRVSAGLDSTDPNRKILRPVAVRPTSQGRLGTLAQAGVPGSGARAPPAPGPARADSPALPVTIIEIVESNGQPSALGCKRRLEFDFISNEQAPRPRKLTTHHRRALEYSPRGRVPLKLDVQHHTAEDRIDRENAGGLTPGYTTEWTHVAPARLLSGHQVSNHARLPTCPTGSEPALTRDFSQLTLAGRHSATSLFRPWRSHPTASDLRVDVAEGAEGGDPGSQRTPNSQQEKSLTSQHSGDLVQAYTGAPRRENEVLADRKRKRVTEPTRVASRAPKPSTSNERQIQGIPCRNKPVLAARINQKRHDIETPIERRRKRPQRVRAGAQAPGPPAHRKCRGRSLGSSRWLPGMEVGTSPRIQEQFPQCEHPDSEVNLPSKTEPELTTR